MTTKKTTIKDIYNGENISCWEDECFVTLSIGLVSIGIPKEEWPEIKKELKKLVK